MKVLIVKTSSLGDLIHTLPAVTDAASAIEDISFDWVAEEAFTEIPSWHPAVERVIPVAIRRWRKSWIRSWLDGEIKQSRQELRREEYDLIIDAQGLNKSALLARMARGFSVGLDSDSTREPGAALHYNKGIPVPRDMHAIERVRSLFAQSLGYSKPDSEPDYGLSKSHQPNSESPYLVFLHGTTWVTKLWPVKYWVEISKIAASNGFNILLPWGSEEEKQRAEQIIKESGSGELLPRMSLGELKDRLSGASGVVGVDSGLAHLAAALSVPAVTLYGPTRTDLTGAIGLFQINLQAEFECAPCMLKDCEYKGYSDVTPACFGNVSPDMVWDALQSQMGKV